MTKKEVLEYLRKNELNIQSAHAAVVALDLVFCGYIDSDKVHGVGYAPIFSHVCSENIKPFYQIIPQKIITQVSRRIYFDYCKDPKILDNRIKRHKELEKELDRLWKRRSKTEPVKFYKEFIEISREWWWYGSIGEDKAEVINQEITPRFAKRHNLTIEKARELMAILSFPKEQSVFNLERKNFLEICIDVLDKKDLKEKIKKYIKDYFWFKTDFYKTIHITPELLLKEVSLETEKRTKEDILGELKEIEGHFEKIHRDKKKIALSLKLTSQDKKDIRFAELSTYWFDQRKLGMTKQLNYLFSFLEEVAKEHNLTYHDLVDSTVEEVGSFLKDKKMISDEEKEKRKKGIFLVYEKNKKVKIFYDNNAQEMLNTVLYSEEEEVKGMVASTGGVDKIEGKVRVVINPEREEFHKDEILVTSMTRIEFVPLMRKAKAIITNEGGIACHAAIVSRELGIPCIIGTKIATKMLKNDDLVEMDVNKGVVKILKR